MVVGEEEEGEGKEGKGRVSRVPLVLRVSSRKDPGLHHLQAAMLQLGVKEGACKGGNE